MALEVISSTLFWDSFTHASASAKHGRGDRGASCNYSAKLNETTLSMWRVCGKRSKGCTLVIL